MVILTDRTDAIQKGLISLCSQQLTDGMRSITEHNPDLADGQPKSVP